MKIKTSTAPFLFLFTVAIFTVFKPFELIAKKKLKKIVIDAGHGGIDPGCHGVYSYEKDITLSIAKKLGDKIKREMRDVKIIYTRDSDYLPGYTTNTKQSLIERTNIANNAKADLFVSIHVNSTPKRNAAVSGTLVLVCGDDRVKEKTENVAENVNNLAEEQDLLDPMDPTTQILVAQYSQAFLSESVYIATKINDEFSAQGRVTEGVRQQSLQVLASSAMPGVLVEIGYLNNVEEENYLNSDRGQDEVMNAIFNGIKYYKEHNDAPLNDLGNTN